MSTSYRCVIMRGGTSKALFLRESDLPKDPKQRDSVILSLYGSPDKRQIDGLGGAEPLTSKLAIIGPSEANDADISYTFGQVDIDSPYVDYKSLCGNISSAVGHYAVYEGLVKITEPTTIVKAFNTNLKRMINIEVPIKEGKPLDKGTYTIPGVPGSGAKIQLDLYDTAGGATGKLLPTGSPIDTISIPGIGEIEATLIDIGNAHVFIRANDVGLTGIESPAEIDRDHALLQKLELIRAYAGKEMGIIQDVGQSASESPATPIIGIIASPSSYKDYLEDNKIQKEDIDVVARLIYMQITHKTYAGTSTACTGVASKIEGTIVYESLINKLGNSLRIGHPAGVIETKSIVENINDEYMVECATLGRTARRLMEGYAFIPE